MEKTNLRRNREMAGNCKTKSPPPLESSVRTLLRWSFLFRIGIEPWDMFRQREDHFAPTSSVASPLPVPSTHR